MTIIEDIEHVIRIGGCVMMGVGVTPEKYRLLLEGATNQDYIVIGAKVSNDADHIASKMSGELLEPKFISVSGSEMKVYFIKSEKANRCVLSTKGNKTCSLFGSSLGFF